MSSIQQKLVEIFDSQSFEKLEAFKKEAVWGEFSTEEKKLLATLLVKQGVLQLKEGNSKSLESFEIANSICACRDLLYEQASALSQFKENIRCLTLALQSIGKALAIDAEFCESWILQAKLLFAMACFEEEASCFYDAAQSFAKAYACLESQAGESLEDHTAKPLLLWDWAKALFSLGKASGEPSDLFAADEKFRKAYLLHLKTCAFLIDFGKTQVELAVVLNNPHYFYEALSLFKEATEQNPQLFEGWYQQASCLQQLAACEGRKELFEEADDCFLRAVQLSPDCSDLWMKWAKLEAAFGKLKKEEEVLRSSLFKFEKAHQLDPENPEVLMHWADCELSLGAFEDNLEYIQSAKEKVENCLRLELADASLWYLYGLCFLELGHYFEDEAYCQEAIEKFYYGLSLYPETSSLWYGLAIAYYALGEMTGDIGFYEKASKCCANVESSNEAAPAPFWNVWGVSLLKLAEASDEVSYVEMAIEKFEKALKHPVQQIDGSEIDLEWIYNFSCAYDLLGELREEPHCFEKAIQIFSQILQLEPDYIMARYSLAVALSHLGDATLEVDSYYKAIEQYQIVLEQEPENDLFHLDCGITLTHVGLLVHDSHQEERSQEFFRQAETHLMQASALGNMQAYYQLAGLYSVLHHFDHAMHYLEKAHFYEALPGIEELLHDEWLEPLRKTPAFRQFIHELSMKQQTDEKG